MIKYLLWICQKKLRRHSVFEFRFALCYTVFMFEVRVEADFAAAHFLKDYHGKCENLHGHNYKVFVHVEGSRLNEGGMLMDFTQLKSALREVLALVDHTNLNDIEFFEDNPSAERIAMFIYERLVEKLPELKAKRESGCARICKVDVFETETSRARYIVD